MKRIPVGLIFFSLGFIACFVLGQLPQNWHINASEILAHVTERKPRPVCSVMIERDGYALSYDTRTRNAKWVYEVLSLGQLSGNVKRDNFSFKEDSLIPKILRASLCDYSKSGFDRGHLAAAANHKDCERAMGDTFYLSNVCPQNQKFNRGYWARLEKHVRDITNQYGIVEVFTGPLYLPQEDATGKRWVRYQVIGENDVAVPTHFFKVIVTKNSIGYRSVNAYILPNSDIGLETPLKNFETTLDKVQKTAGIVFFPDSTERA
jgi:endonuclease G